VTCADDDCARRDLVGGWSALVLWGIPTALILLGAFVPAARAALWIPSFAVMGVSCLANARRCGRLHCHATGPLFLAAALATTLDALALVAVPWTAILGVAAAGTALAFGIEWIHGRYVGTPAA
jgi:hypothetical protein